MEATLDADTNAVTDICRNENVSDTVISTVATAVGADPLDLEPLYSVVDPDALDSLFRSSMESPAAALELRFSMAGCQVTVHADGEVAVTPPPTGDATSTADASRKA